MKMSGNPYNATNKLIRKCNQAQSDSVRVKLLEEKVKNQASTLRFFEKSNQRLKIDLRRVQTSLKRVESEKLQLQKESEEQRKVLQDALDGDKHKTELDEIKSCKICNEPYDDTERETVKLECPHIFCKKCAIQFKRSCNSLCPFCRKYFGQFYPVKF